MTAIRCATCEIEFQVPNYRATKARYCSRVCMAVGYSQRPAFYVPPTNKVSVSCETCGITFEVIASRVTHGRGRHCSPECQYKAAIGSDPDTDLRSFTCLACAKPFVLRASTVRHRDGAGKYCSRACRDVHRKGPNHPGFISGSAGDHRGPNWQSQKRKAKRRDGHICQHCHADELTVKERFGQPLHVHHIRPYHRFACYQDANRLENLVTLCPRCHRKADVAWQKAHRQVRPLSIGGVLELFGG